jgi:hypothetical protein
MLWNGKPNTSGYGVMRYLGVHWLAHRAAYAMKVGEIPEGLQVLHRCDVRACVNPAHLFLGTNAENVADKISKGRQRNAKGENHPNSKLTAEQVLAIRADTRIHREIAADYGLCKSAVGYIKRRKLWQHI